MEAVGHVAKQEIHSIALGKHPIDTRGQTVKRNKLQVSSHGILHVVPC